MGYQNWYVGQTFPALNIPLNVENTPDTLAATLSSGAFSLTIRTAAGVDSAGTGTFAWNTLNPPALYYTFSNGDCATAQSVTLFVKATMLGGYVAVYDPIPFTFTAS